MPADVDECPHGMGDPAWCTLCNGRDQRAAQLELQMARTRDPDSPRLLAHRDSTCTICDNAIADGERIVRNRLQRWVHAHCAT